jgi:FKBP-type peptidyl-prolyl cis-trans isomerase
MDNKKMLLGAACIPVVAAIVLVVLTAVADDKKDENVVTTSSGLKYVELKVGEGKEAKEGSRVRVHYTGTLENGKKFDSSLDKGVPYPVTIGAGEVIKGWEEGLQGMKAGGKRKLIVPAKLAYGEPGRPPAIPPNATLLFELELVSVD